MYEDLTNDNLSENNANLEVNKQDPLLLSLDDEKLNKVLDERIEYAESEYKKLDIYERRKLNLNYYLGKHEPNDKSKLKDYQTRYMDNIIYEAEASIKPIALSRMPDLLIVPSDENETKGSEKLTKILNNDLRKRTRRRVMGLAHKHLPIYFHGCVKYRWDSAAGANGDYVFEAVNPENIICDFVPSTNADDMGFIVHKNPMTLKEALVLFPNKKAELLDAVFGGNEDSRQKDEQKGYATRVVIEEVWFNWFDGDEEGVRREEYVLWRFNGGKKVILNKMKNPNFDYEGHPVFVTTDEAGEERVLSEEEIMQVAFGMIQIPVQQKKTFKNYFQQPHKPFIFINYDWLGNMPLDNTSRIEQVILLQDNVDIEGRQITDITHTSRGKWIGSAEGGLKKKDMQEFDPTDPNQNMFVQQDMDKAIKHFPGEQPSPALYQTQEINRARIFQKMGVNDTTRGEVTTDTATTAQISREQDFGRLDDLVEDTINYLAEQMALAAMHMIKLRYTKDHVISLVGKDGKMVFETINSDMVEDGMDVMVYASATDKILRKREAFERAGLQLTDPLSFFEDTEASNPKGRTRRLLSFITDPNTYLMTEVEEMTTEEMAAQLGAQPGQPEQTEQPEQPSPGGGDAMGAITQIEQGQMPQPPQQITPLYVDTINEFLQSPRFMNLDPQIQQLATQFAQQLAV